VDNLLATLLQLAPARNEDAITEIFAWILRHDPVVCMQFVTLLRNVRATPLPDTLPRVATQVTEGNARYDLLLQWQEARAVIEVKVDASLGWRAVAEAPPEAPTVESQVAKYLRRANVPGSLPTWVFTLSSESLPLESATCGHVRCGGQLHWHDVRRVLEACPSAEPSVARVSAWFLDLLRRKGMTYEPLSREGLAAVAPYLAFKRTVDAMIDRSVHALKGESTFQALARGGTWRQEAHQRIGWVLARDRAAGHLAFVGISVHPLALRDGSPDLLFFLETPPSKPAAAALRAERPVWEATVAELNARGTARWALGDGWPIVSATEDLSTLLDVADQTRAMLEWYRGRLADVSNSGLLTRYLTALEGPHPVDP
jgi:hypothetical protein